jgi:hypothetical protein
MKYSRTDRPSRKFDLIGRGMISPFGLATSPRMAAICRSWVMLPRAPELAITKNGLVVEKFSSIASATLEVASVQISISSCALGVGDDTAGELLLDLLRPGLRARQHLGLEVRGLHVGDGHGDAGRVALA